MKRKSLHWLGWGVLVGLVWGMITVGPAQALDGASRFFVGGSCPFTLFTPPPDSFTLYSFHEEQSPPPECRSVVQIGANHTVNWIADRAPLYNTTFAPGVWDYHFEWAVSVGSSSQCYRYYIMPGVYDPSGAFTPVDGGIQGYFPTSPLNGTIQGTQSLLPFTVPAGSRFGIAYQFRVGHDCPVASLNLTTASSVWFAATTSDPPYPLSPIASAVPTMTQWGLLLMSILIAMGGVWAVRKRAKA
jgi:hypothetical protein